MKKNIYNLKKRIKKKIPSDDKIGRQLEKKLNHFSRIFSNLSVVVFSQKALENISHYSSRKLAILMIVLIDLILIFPTNAANLSIDTAIHNFIIVFAAIITIIVASFTIMKFIFKSTTTFKAFFSTTSTTLFMSIILISLPIGLVFFAVFIPLKAGQDALIMIFNMIPYYNYLIFGWSAEVLSKLKGLKRISFTLITLILILTASIVVQTLIT